MCCVFFFKQKTAYEMRISDWSSDVCSSDLFRMAFVADQDALTTVTAVARHFDMDLGHQWAGGVEHLQAPTSGFGTHRLGNPVGTEDHDDETGRASCRERVCQYG